MPKEQRHADKPPDEKNSARNDGAKTAPEPLGIDEPAAGEAAAKSKDSAQEQRGPVPAGGKVKQPVAAEDAPATALIITCPYCGNRCAANNSSPLFTRYYCPTKGCSYSQKVPKPDIAKRLNRQRQRDENDKGFSARP